MDIEKSTKKILALMSSCFLTLYEMKQTIKQKENRKLCKLKSIKVYILGSYYTNSCDEGLRVGWDKEVQLGEEGRRYLQYYQQ